MSRSDFNPWLHRFAAFTALMTLALIGVGGVVTSKGAGMAVPDWPTTYGYNMFLFPISQWKGGILFEHSHRLIASGVGFLTIILSLWLFAKDPRRWLRWLGVIALVLVILQGVLGGLRVVALKDEIGIFHATLAQLFFVLVGAIALFTSSRWNELIEARPLASVVSSKRWVTMTAVVILFQLLLGATMRHQHAGLAVPDFPLAYGEIYPKTDAAFLDRINLVRPEGENFHDITPFQVHLHMAHRFNAILVLCLVFTAVWKVRQQWGHYSWFGRMAFIWGGLVVIQAGFGAWTVWSNKAADIATLHVVLGALTLLLGSLLALSLNWKRRHPAPRTGQDCQTSFTTPEVPWLSGDTPAAIGGRDATTPPLVHTLAQGHKKNA